MSNAEWKVESRGHVQVWTIQGEARRNTLNVPMVEELGRLVEGIRGDKSVRAVVITGAGDKAFCAGADLKDREKMSHEDVKAWLELLHRVFRSLETASQAFVAAINGAAFGGGLELALACDVRVADPAAKFGLTEVKLGIIPGGGGTIRLPRAIGHSLAKDLILTGRIVNAPEALTMGLVSRVSESGWSVEAGTKFAEEIAGNAPLAVAAAKRSVDDGYGLPFDAASSLERSLYHPLLGSADRLEGLASFREKRKPVFKGE